jgi:DNA-binding Xre family transcriptional regulator
MARLSKGQSVQMNVLGKICKELQCNIGDIVDYIDDDAGGDIK